jgi:nicotinamidase-related amidase
MTRLSFATPLLLLIDFQQGFEKIPYWGGERNNSEAEVNARQLLERWRHQHLPVVHIRHSSLTKGSPLSPTNPGFQFKEGFTPLPQEKTITKQVNSAFIGTDLKAFLDSHQIRQIIVAGLTTDHCVSTTTRMAANFGFETYVAHDATATFPKTGFDGTKFSAEMIHQTALASLNGEFATIVNVNSILKAI